MDKNAIIELFSECDFDGELCSEVIQEKIFSYLPESFRYDWHEGASKLVIIPYNKEGILEDYVIKIPYNGDCYEGEFEQFYSANNTDNYYWDYCMTEMLIWRLAKVEKVHKAFAKERIIGMIKGHPIYIQQRVDVCDDEDEFEEHNSLTGNEKREKTKKYCEKKGFVVFYDEALSWQADALEYYGPKQFDKIMSFIQNNHIGDFHNKNLGYIGLKPVFLDYSDFNS